MVLFPTILPTNFDKDICKIIEDNYKRYMDDGTIPLPTVIDRTIFLHCLNSLHKDIIFTLEEPTINKDKNTQSINFLDIKIIEDKSNVITTEIYYKNTNSHQYLDYNSQHPKHTKENIPMNLAKKIITFNSNDEKVEEDLEDLEKWLKNAITLQLL